MFKKYTFKWDDLDGKRRETDFFVHSKGTRNGFMHRACAIGSIPRLDEKGNDWTQFRTNEEKLFRKRVAKCSYYNRTWEEWPGQTCLSGLWQQLGKLKFVDMSQISQANPFEGGEPDHETLTEPDELFDGFRR